MYSSKGDGNTPTKTTFGAVFAAAVEIFSKLSDIPRDTEGDEGLSDGSSRSHDQHGADKRASSNVANLSHPDALAQTESWET